MSRSTTPLTDLGPAPHLGFSGSGIDRAATLRNDPAALATLADRPEAAAYAVSGDAVILRRTEAGLGALLTVPQARSLGGMTEVFLGLLDGAARFGVWIDPTHLDPLRERHDLAVMDLRALAQQGLVPDVDLDPIAEAKGLLSWHARHRFCANCGTASVMVEAGWRRDCPICRTQHFPRTDPVAIMLTTDGDDCLLGRSARFPPGMWSCLAGFVEPGETIEEAVRRETLEEAGIRCGEVRYFASQPWPYPSSLMIGCHARALSRDITVDANELEDARWFSRSDAALMLAGRHPAGLTLPRPFAIAHHVVRAWIEGNIFHDPGNI